MMGIIYSITAFISYSCHSDISSKVYNKVNYSDKANWLEVAQNPIKEVDVFYVYPTVFAGTEMINMDINDSVLRSKARIAMKKQIGVYSENCNVFAPYYQQMSMSVLAMPQDSMDKYFRIGYKDVKSAFLHYLKHHNNNRPIILAGHSQGSDMLLSLMMELFSDKELQDKLVAAYLIGYSVTDENIFDCPWLKIAERRDDVGVIITYNTQSEEATGSPVLLPNAHCVNPISWTTDTVGAQRKDNLGAVFFDKYGDYATTILNFTNARISSDGALIADDVDESEYSVEGFPKGVYHVYDYSFFYLNIKENVGERIESYLIGEK